jgi:hypothetical protein
MSVTYYVALPFARTEDGVAPGQAQEMPNEGAAIRRAEAMSRDAENAGALAFKLSGDPDVGSFNDATILKSFGSPWPLPSCLPPSSAAPSRHFIKHWRLAPASIRRRDRITSTAIRESRSVQSDRAC